MLGVVAVAVLGIGAFVALTGDDDAEVGAGRSDERRDDRDDEGSDDDEGSEPASSSFVPADGPAVATDDLAVRLPTGWVGADVSAGIDGVGSALFPDQPAVAAQVEEGMSFLPRAVQIVGIEVAGVEAAAPFVANFNLIADTSVPEGLPLEEVLELETRVAGGMVDVVESEVVEVDGREVGRLRLDFDLYESVGYIVVDDGETFVLTYCFAEVGPEEIAISDGSVATFRRG